MAAADWWPGPDGSGGRAGELLPAVLTTMGWSEDLIAFFISIQGSLCKNLDLFIILACPNTYEPPNNISS